MRILFVGDSLGLPRPHRIKEYSPEEKELAVKYEETYSSIIGSELHKYFKCNSYIEVINRAKRLYTIKDIRNEFADHLFFFEPDVIVMQVGIVDCWFRENRKQFVGIQDYEKHLQYIIGLLKNRPNVRLAIVSIAPTSYKMDKRNPGLNNEIHLYNTILKSYVDNRNIFYINIEKYIDPSHPNKYLLPDDHHLNKHGNKLLANLLLELLFGLICSDEGVKQFNEGNNRSALRYFIESFNNFPLYRDNLFNLLILSYQLGELDTYHQIVNFIKTNFQDEELINIFSVLNKEK